MHRTSTLLSIFTITVLVAMIYLFTGSTNEQAESSQYKNTFKEDYRVYALELPQKMQFADEEVPVSLLDVREKLDREMLVNTYWQSQTMLFIKRSNRWFPVIEPILEEEGVPTDFKYLALIESGFEQVVSPAGATGFWQLMKASAQENGLEITGPIDERYNVEKSTRAACAYLKTAKERFGSWTLAAASYNMGMAGLSRQLERQKATNYYDLVLNSETSRYLFRIFAAKTILENPSDYGFTFREKDLYAPLNWKEITVDSTVNNLAYFAFEQGINYKALKFLNPWLRDSYLPNKYGRTYTIKIPIAPQSDLLIYDKEQVATFTRQKSDESKNEGAED